MDKLHYKLEKYRNRSNRYTCPQCGMPHVFTRYICVETGKHLADYVGRCDREAKCGYHYTPSMYFKDNPWDREERIARTRASPPPPKPDPVYMPIAYAEERVSEESPFAEWLKSVVGTDAARQAISRYYLGATRKGLYKTPPVIFWQIDEHLRVRDGKMMWYKADGHREKFMTWVSAKLNRIGKYPEQDTEKCLFGQHLLKRDGSPVCLVESEKSAVVCSCLYPEVLWLATSGSGGLNKEKMQPLSGHPVLVFPDSGAFGKWDEILLMSGVGYELVNLDNYPPNTDLVDVLIDNVQPLSGEPLDIETTLKTKLKWH